ncbi:hypothetical protein [Streptomyces sp. NPDC001970]
MEEPGRDADGRSAAADFPLFSPPAEWRVKRIGPQRLQPGHTYELFLGDPDRDAYAYHGYVVFRASDVAALRPGQVRPDGRAMSRDAFEERAEDSC